MTETNSLQSIHGTCWPTYPTVCKITALVMGLLLIGAAVAMHYHNVNAIAVYVTSGIGGVATLVSVIATVVSCCRARREKAERVASEQAQESRNLEQSAWDGDLNAIQQAVSKGNRANLDLWLYQAA